MTKRKTLILETILVLGLSLGKSAIYSVLSLINKLSQPVDLSQQNTSMNTSVTPDRSWLDFAYQLAANLFPFFVPALCIFLVWQVAPLKKSPWESLGLNTDRKAFDLGTGFGLAAAVGIPGLAFYLFAREIGINTNIVPANLTEVWWAIPIYILAAFMNACLEEIVMIGYLFLRWRQAGANWVTVIALSAAIRGAYHLYQGFGGGIGNLVMGLAIGWFYKKTSRLWPLIIAHTLLDIASFVGYSLLAPHLSWL